MNAPWPQRTWILSTPRTGSTLLADLLNRATGREATAFIVEPSRDLFGEHFSPDFCKTWADFVRLDPVVTKMHIHWLEERGEAIPPDTKIIRLTRDDKVAQTWSLLVSGKVGFCHATTEHRRNEYLAGEAHVTTTRKEFYDHLHAIERWERLMRLITAGRDTFDVSYEELTSDRRAETLTQVMTFIGLRPDEWTMPDGVKTLALH